MRLQMLAFSMLLCLALTIPANSQKTRQQRPTSPSTSTATSPSRNKAGQSISTYSGLWRGRTRKGQTIEFKVTESGNVEDLMLGGVLDLGTLQGECRFKFIQKTSAKITGRVSRIPVSGLPGLSCGLVINASFMSSTLSKGAVPVCRGKNFLCGTTFSMTTGIYKTDADTWEASLVKSFVALETDHQMPKAFAPSAVLSRLAESQQPGNPSPIIENPKDGSLLALIPAGEFLTNSNRKQRKPFPIALPSFYLSLHEVSNAQYALFLSQTKPTKENLEKWIDLKDEDSFVRTSGNQYVAYGGKGNHAVERVSWHGAKAYCDWAGLRLPTELEWEKAARGTDGREYPWGNNWDETKCRNTSNHGNEGTANVWSYEQGVSPWGVYQMSGNVSEWCADWYDENAYNRYSRGDLTPPTNGTERVERGASWDTYNSDKFRCSYRNYTHASRLQSGSGFRCAKDK